MDNKIISQAEFARILGKQKQTINRFVKRKDCPFDTIMISGTEFVELTDRTKTWMSNQNAEWQNDSVNFWDTAL